MSGGASIIGSEVVASEVDVAVGADGGVADSMRMVRVEVAVRSGLCFLLSFEAGETT
jgi:hypothetical protein